MLKSDALSQLKQLKQDIKASRNLHEGVVKGTTNKFGFVTLDSGKDVFLPADEMAKVLPGDRIEVEVKKEPKNKVYALIERLIDSPTKEFFGKYITKGSAHFIEPDIAGMNQWFFVPPNKRKGANAKEYVRCKLTQHPFKAGKAQAAVLEVIGAENAPAIEWDYAIAKHGLAQAWSAQAEQELEQITEASIADAPERSDLTALAFVTIDSASTTDMDDALWAEAKADGGWTLKVAIADPQALIPAGSALEKEALARASSAYFPGRVISMLPAKLSSELGSLQPQQTRLAKVLTLDIAADGAVADLTIVNARVCSSAKLSYHDASKLIAGEEVAQANEQRELLQTLASLSAQLDAWRQANALSYEPKPEFYLELNEQHKIKQILPKEQTAAHKVVEACMVAANMAVANLLAAAEVDSIFVNNAGVRQDRRDIFAGLIKDKLGEEPVLDDLSAYTELVAKLKTDANKPLFTLLSRQLEKSKLAARAQGHFAMGLPAYTTFTSPLRKASDYLLHKQVDQFLASGKWQPIAQAQLEAIELQGQAVRNASYDIEQWLKCQFMNKSDTQLEAEVLRVFASGCQVRLKANGIEGFISARELEGKYSFDQAMMTLKGADYSFELEQSLFVDFKQVDWKRKQIQFVPAKEQAASTGE